MNPTQQTLGTALEKIHLTLKPIFCGKQVLYLASSFGLATSSDITQSSQQQSLSVGQQQVEPLPILPLLAFAGQPPFGLVGTNFLSIRKF